jgi:hypothetical protein
MFKRIVFVLAALPFAGGCAARMLEPKQPMADAEAAARSAREVGADYQPTAKLHAALAEEQIGIAKALVAKGEHERATYVLMRARADGELALALAREQNALVDKQKTIEQSAATLNASQGINP